MILGDRLDVIVGKAIGGGVQSPRASIKRAYTAALSVCKPFGTVAIYKDVTYPVIYEATVP
jgi:hypothetical protein